jgi:hypothetical protein
LHDLTIISKGNIESVEDEGGRDEGKEIKGTKEEGETGNILFRWISILIWM